MIINCKINSCISLRRLRLFLIVSFLLLYKSHPSLFCSSFLSHSLSLSAARPLLPLSAYFQEQLESCFWLCGPALSASDSQQCGSGAALRSGGEAGWRSRGEGPLSQTARPLACWASGSACIQSLFICSGLACQCKTVFGTHFHYAS